MEDFIKNIIVEKRFFELTDKEKNLIKDWASNEDEFEALKMTFLSISDFNKENETKLSPSVKERLNDRFAAKHAHQSEGYWNRFLIFFFPRDTQLFKKPAFQLVMVALIVAFMLPLLWQDKPMQYAMHEESNSLDIDTIDSIEENNKQEESIQKSLNREGKEEVHIDSDNVVVEIIEENDMIIPEKDISTKHSPQTESFFEITKDWDNSKNEEPLVAVPSTKRASADIQQMDDMPMISSKGFTAEYKNTIPKTVETSETLGLLTALF